MNTRSIVDHDHSIWPGCEVVMMGAPAGMEDEVAPCEVLRESDAIHVPWTPNEVDVAALAHGGTIWLTVLGSLPPHTIQVSKAESG